VGVLKVQQILDPDAADAFALERVEAASSFDDIVFPLGLESLAIGEGEHSWAIFLVKVEDAFEAAPLLADFVEVAVVEASFDGFFVFVEEGASAVEAAALPPALVVGPT
jgi:hypothetical protein